MQGGLISRLSKLALFLLAIPAISFASGIQNPGSSGGGYSTVQDEGSDLTQRATVNFTGSGVSCVDNSGSSKTDCTINAGAATAGGVTGNVQYNRATVLSGSSEFNIWPSSVVVSTGSFIVYTSTIVIDSSMTLTHVSTMTFGTSTGIDIYGGLGLSGTAGNAGQWLRSAGAGNPPVWDHLITVTTAQITTTGSTLSNIPSMAMTLTANTTYQYDCFLIFQTTTTTTGERFAFTFPGTPNLINYVFNIPVAADGTGGLFSGWGTSSGDAVVGSGVQAANTKYTTRGYGVVGVGSSGGTMNVQYASELVNPATATIEAGSVCYLNQFP